MTDAHDDTRHDTNAHAEPRTDASAERTAAEHAADGAAAHATGAAGRADATSEGRAESRKKGYGETFTEEFRVSGEALVGKVKALLREGNIRRITIKNDEGRTLIEIPLTIGVIGTALLPVWAAIGAIAALVANLTLAVERVDDGAAAEAAEAAKADAEAGEASMSGYAR